MSTCPCLWMDCEQHQRDAANTHTHTYKDAHKQTNSNCELINYRSKNSAHTSCMCGVHAIRCWHLNGYLYLYANRQLKQQCCCLFRFMLCDHSLPTLAPLYVSVRNACAAPHSAHWTNLSFMYIYEYSHGYWYTVVGWVCFTAHSLGPSSLWFVSVYTTHACMLATDIDTSRPFTNQNGPTEGMAKDGWLRWYLRYADLNRPGQQQPAAGSRQQQQQTHQRHSTSLNSYGLFWWASDGECVFCDLLPTADAEWCARQRQMYMFYSGSHKRWTRIDTFSIYT